MAGHSATVPVTRLAPDAAESLVSTEMAWLVSHAPVEVSFAALGAPTIVGGSVAEAFLFAASVML